ncbi:MAG: formylglycine-generating enzyme family protein [Oryzomonas sp.]|uniref:formylglycine-generating enzyme family protein n=1 Tax=Oryzomonas sp. TaxID=2855186 RepID=UPI00284A8E85|nr:formylglycine-generating enzyme family protein [Oryzomonas sp.]MDR3580390.1 formylglycine-generating enzyme family protein [Oryzomonas sp.]
MKKLLLIILVGTLLLATSIATHAADSLQTSNFAATASPSTTAPYIDAITGMRFVFVKGGCYMMGSSNGRNDAHPIHQVCINDFYIGKYEVTQGQWEVVMGNNSSYFKQCGPDCPADAVSWNNAQKFINILNAKSGKKYRLPSEAEWEYAARSGGQDEKWAGTNDEASLGEYAWYKKNSDKITHKVGLKKPNGLGIHDMSGNELEWCQDWFKEDYYKDSPKNNPLGPNNGEMRVLRGGFYGGNAKDSLMTSYRVKAKPDFNGIAFGMRLVLPAQ